MVSEKKRLQQLRQPDEFQKRAFRLVDWGLGHKRQLLLLLLPVLLISIAGISWRYVQNQQGEKRRAELQKIDAKFNKALEEVAAAHEKIQNNIEEIESKISGSANTTDPADKTPAVALSETERAALLKQRVELEAKAQSLKPDHSQTLDAYKAFYQKNSTNPEGWRAGLAVITGLVQAEKFAEAAKLAQELIERAAGVDFYQQQVRSLYISLLEEQGQFAAALSETAKLLSSADEETKPKALLMKGRLELLSGKKEQGLATLDQLVNSHNSSQEAQKAKAIKALW